MEINYCQTETYGYNEKDAHCSTIAYTDALIYFLHKLCMLILLDILWQLASVKSYIAGLNEQIIDDR
jgi:hypothetical protein